MSSRDQNFKNFWRDFSVNKIAVFALFIFLSILFVAIFAPLVSPTDPYDLNSVSIMNSRMPPMSEDFAGNLYVLGTDGMGRSETRETLRDHFEVDGKHIALAALTRLAKAGQFDESKLAEAVKELEINPDKVSPLYA